MSLVYLRAPTVYQTPEPKKPRRKHRSKEPSNGEKFISKCLDELKLSYTQESSLQTLPDLRYDFILKDQKILIEYDSEIHFKFCKYLHKNPLKFWKGKERDKLKTAEAVRLGYLIIRIDYTLYDKPEEVKKIIMQSVSEYKDNGKFVCTNPELYRYISEPVNQRITKKYLKP